VIESDHIESIKRCKATEAIDETSERESSFWRCNNCKNEKISDYKDECDGYM
jgi:hypothetical protein